MRRFSEDQWFERFVDRREPAALAEVFDQLAPDLLRVGLHLCGRMADAEDLVQQTFLAAIEQAGTWDRGRGLFPWLVGILTNQARLQRRAAARTPDPARLPQRAGEDPGVLAERAELEAAVGCAVAELGEVYRPVLHLHLHHGLNAKEIAAALGRPAGTVRTQLVRGLLQLRRALPVGLAVLASATVGVGRGLAAVRQAVLASAGAEVALAPGASAGAVIGGVVVMKSFMSVCAVALVLVLWWWGSAAAPDVSVRTGAAAGAATRAAAGLEEGPTTKPAARQELLAPGVAAGQPTSLRVRVQMTLSGRSAGDGAEVHVPLCGTTLQLWQGESALMPFDPGAVALAVTDAAGEARLSGLAPGPWRVLLVADREATAVPVVLDPGRETCLDLGQRMARLVRGRVVDGDGQAVAEAEVWLCRYRRSGLGRDRLPEPLHLGVRRAALSDSAGRFAVGAATDEEEIGACKVGFAPSFGRSTEDRSGAELQLVLGGTCATVAGCTVDSAGQPVAGALVYVTPAGQDARRMADGTTLVGRLPQLARTDAGGRFEFGSLPPGKHKVWAWAEPRTGAGSDVEVAPFARAEVELKFEGGITVVGTVRRADGVPVRVEVKAIARRGDDGHFNHCETRADGSYVLQWIPRRSFVVSVRLGYGAQVAEREFGKPEPGYLRCDFVLPEAAALRGRVVDARGQGLAGWNVSAGDETSKVGGVAIVTDAQGCFEFRYLQGQTFRVSARPVGGEAAPAALERKGVAPGDGELELRIPDAALPDAAIAGRLVDRAGAPRAEAEVSLDPRTGWFPERFRRTVRTGADGAFRFAGLSAGRFGLRAAVNGRRPRDLTTVDLAHRQELAVGDLVAVPPAVLRVEATRADGSPWSGALPSVQVTDVAGKRIEAGQDPVDGGVELELEPGKVTVWLGGDDLIATPQEVELASGHTRTVRVAVAIGRSRELVFNGDGAFRPDRKTMLHVEVHRADGTRVLKDDARHHWNLRGFHYWYLHHVFPCGRYQVTAVADSGQRYRAAFEVRDDLEDPTQIDVPLVR